VVAVAVFLIAATGLKAREEDWPRWRGPRLDGVSRETGLLNPWPKDGPSRVWQVTLSGGFSSVAVADGKVFTQTKQGNQEIALCLDAATGKEIWRYAHDANYDAHVTFTGGPRPDTRSGPRATPTVDGDRVYVMGATGILVALDVRSGKKIWQREMLRPAGQAPVPGGNAIFPPAAVPMHGISSSPLVVGDRVFVAPGGPNGKTLAALDKNDGRIIWESLDDGVGHSSPIWADVAGTPQLIFLTATRAVGVAPQDGTLLWSHPWKTTFDLNIATPVYADRQVFISSNYGKGGALLRLTNTNQPDLVWESPSMQNHFSTSVLYDGHLYGFSGTRLRCVDVQTGKVLWDNIGVGMGNVLVADGNLIVLGDRGQLVLAKATPTAYTEISRVQVFDEETLTWTVPVLSGGRLFVRHQNGLAAFDLRRADGGRP
jgi:outer membrane protein assembly factor BamB